MVLGVVERGRPADIFLWCSVIEFFLGPATAVVFTVVIRSPDFEIYIPCGMISAPS